MYVPQREVDSREGTSGQVLEQLFNRTFCRSVDAFSGVASDMWSSNDCGVDGEQTFASRTVERCHIAVLGNDRFT